MRFGRGLAVGFGLGAAILAVGPAVAEAAPDTGPADTGAASSAPGVRPPSASRGQPQRRAARAAASPAAETSGRPTVPSAAAAVRTPRPARTVPPRAAGQLRVDLPPVPVGRGRSFTVSPDSIADVAAGYVADGGDPGDGARFFFGELAVASLDTLAGPDLTAEQARLQLGNLAVSGYFGGIWLRDNLREAPAVAAPAMTATTDLTVSAIGIRLFDVLATGLMGAASTRSDWIARTAAHASVPVLLALYGYNRGYLEVLLENPPAGVPSARDTLTCDGFLDCNSDAFPLDIGTRYDAALAPLDAPPGPGWQEMKLWSAVLEGATGAGRFVWEAIAGAGAFSPASYQALVELSSAYLMVSKAAVLSSMLGYAGGDAGVARSSLRLQAGLWIWSGAYFAGLASTAPAGTMPAIVVA